MSKKIADIKMVSKLAEVSIATVSRAYLNPGKLAPATLAKVRAAAEQLNYKPNAMAQALRLNRTNSILVIVPDIANSFYSRVLEGIEACAKKRGISPLLANSNDDEEFERNCLDMVLARRTDGIIQLGARSIEYLLKGESSKNIPFVHAVERSPSSQAPSVGIDNCRAAMDMTQHILSLGHRKVGLIGGAPTSDITRERLEGYKNALAAANIAFDDNLIEYGEYSASSGLSGARDLLSRAPEVSAIFCLSDDIAFGAMAAARELGRNVPEDLSIAGFDNVDFGQYSFPPLSTVKQPSRRIGIRAMELMFELLDGKEEATPEPVILEAELVIRQSLAPAGSKPT